MSEDESVSASLLLLGDLLEVLVNDSDSEHDSGSGTNCAHEVGKDAESSNAHTSKGGSNSDVSAKVADHRLFTVTSLDDHILVHQLTHNIARRAS